MQILQFGQFVAQFHPKTLPAQAPLLPIRPIQADPGPRCAAGTGYSRLTPAGRHDVQGVRSGAGWCCYGLTVGAQRPFPEIFPKVSPIPDD
jgi:hypothetical protein